MRALVLALALAAGCTSELSGPTITIHLIDPETFTATDRDFITSAAWSWSELGFDPMPLTEDPTRAPNACPHGWNEMQPVPDCTIDVGLMRVPMLEETQGHSGLTDRATGLIRIDAKYDRFLLMAVVTHELGHAVLDTGTHLPAGEVGVMMRAGAETEISAADLRLACSSIGRGC